MLKPQLVLYSEQKVSTTSSIDYELLAMVGTDRPRFGFIPSQADRDRYLL